MRRKSRLRRPSPPGGQERWLITYADLITLLMIFFVVMFSMSKIDTDKYDSLSAGLQITFHNGKNDSDSVMEQGNGVTGANDRSKQPQPVAEPAKKSENEPMTARELAFRKQEEQLQQFMGVIQEYVKSNKLESLINVTDAPKGITIKFSDPFLFELGKAEIKAESEPTLKKLASLFTQLDTSVSIEGHTDDLKIQPGSTYADNWELSAARALSVLRYYVDTEHLDAKQFQIAGYADTHPVAPNDSEENRKKNRRVEMIVLRKLQQ